MREVMNDYVIFFLCSYLNGEICYCVKNTMPNLFINGIKIYPSVIKLINNNVLTTQYEFAQKSDSDTHVTFKNIGTYEMDEIAQLYIANRGTLDVDSDCMIHLLGKYPEYVNIADDYEWDNDALTTYLKIASDESIMENINMIIKAIKEVDNIPFIMKAYKRHAKLQCSSEYYRIVPFITKLCDTKRRKNIHMPPIKHIHRHIVKFERPIEGWQQHSNIIDTMQGDMTGFSYVADNLDNPKIIAGPKIIKYMLSFVYVHCTCADMDKHDGPAITIDDDAYESFDAGQQGITKEIVPKWEVVNAHGCDEKLVSTHNKVICSTNCHIAANCEKLHIVEYYYDIYDIISADNELCSFDNKDVGFLSNRTFDITFEAPQNIKMLIVNDAKILYGGISDSSDVYKQRGVLDLSKFTNLELLVLTINCTKCDGVISAPHVRKLSMRLHNIEHKIIFDMPKLEDVDITYESIVEVPLEFKYDGAYIKVVHTTTGPRSCRF